MDDIEAMTPDEFAVYLRRKREETLHIQSYSKRNNGRGMKDNAQLFVSSSVRRTMQRRRTK